MIKVKVVDRGEVTVSIRVRVSLASGLGLVTVLKSVYDFQLAQPRYHLGIVHAIVYGQATTSFIIVVSLYSLPIIT